MGKNEQLQEQMQNWLVDDSDESRLLPAIKKLPAKLRPIGLAVFGFDEKGEGIHRYWRNEDSAKLLARETWLAKWQPRIDSISVVDRKKVFAVLGKELASSVEAAWQYLKIAPYDIGHFRTPFRAPKNPDLTCNSRIKWLQRLASRVSRFRPEVLTPSWLAAWSAHAMPYQSGCVVPILIAAMNAKGKVGDEVFDILFKTVTREHPVGIMSNFVIGSLLGSSRSAGWEIIEKTLLAAQRQEGLRQSILDSADLSHPEAFRRLLQTIVDENLIRFSSVARSVDVWLRLLWDSSSTKTISENVEAVLAYLNSPAQQKKGLASKDAETVYRALWVSATRDATTAASQAKKLLKNASAEIRFVAAWLLHQLGIDVAMRAKAFAIDDENLQVAVLASCGLRGLTAESEVIEKISSATANSSVNKDYFERIEALYQRLPEKPKTLDAIVWPWTERTIRQSDLCGQLMSTLGDRPPTRMLPYLKGLESWQKGTVIDLLAKQKKWDALTRTSLIELTGNASPHVRNAAFKSLENKKLKSEEYLVLEGYLGRTAVDLRTKVVSQLLNQSDADVLSSAQRLLDAEAKKRLAGLEILRQMAEADRSRIACLAAAEQYRAGRKKISKAEEIQLGAIADSDRPVWTLENGLGLMDPQGRSEVKKPSKRKVSLITSTAIECLKSLDDLIHQNRAESVRCKTWNGWEEKLIGELRYELPHINPQKPMGKQLKEFPLWKTWAKWRKDRPAKLRDKDGLELLRACTACSFMDRWDYDSILQFEKTTDKKTVGAVLGEYARPKLQYMHIVSRIVSWLFYSEIPKGSLDYLIDCKENTGALVTDAMHDRLLESDEENTRHTFRMLESKDWRSQAVFSVWPGALNAYMNITGQKMSLTQRRRIFELGRFWDEPISGARRMRVDFPSLAFAFQKKYATQDDLVDALIGAGREKYRGFEDLAILTARVIDKDTRKTLENTNGLPDLVDRIRETLLEVELGRGEKETVSSEAALKVNSFYGIKTLFKIQEALNGSYKVLNGWSANPKDSRPATLTQLIKATYPSENETSADFIQQANQAIADGYFSDDQLLQLAFLAPQWSKFVGEMLKWDGFSEGLYWFLAHMSTWMSGATSAAATAEGILDEDDVEEFEVDGEGFERPAKLTPWQRLILERTPLTPNERDEGAVDVDWFHRTFALLGEKRWARMAQSAKLAANSAQAKKAQFLADALLGNTPRKKLVEGIKKRNLKENVRLLGLLPLAKGAKRDKDILERYEVLLAYKKYAQKLSSLTRPEAMRALEIGMSNLARIAGFPDPLRLEWALEAESIKDLAKGPVVITKDGVTVTLRLDEDSKPEISIRRGDKPLKSVPAAIRKKHASVAELTERAKELRKKSSRIRQSLESAMCRGDSIEAAELVKLMKHAILAPNLKRIVLVGDGIVGYPDKNGKALRDHRGKLEPIKKKESLKIAHSADLLKLGDWDKWQRECFQAERVQPFKQIFRELYVPTKKEKTAKISSRFSGQQVGPKQAMALWNSRGWNTQDEVLKVFHDCSIIASVSFQYDVGTAAEIEGLTVESVQFQNRDDYKLIKLKDVPPAVFSEVMRDVDLVISVAHRGEVDPESSESTIEMRSTLIRETCALLSLKNVKFKPSHIVIEGHYGEYSLHLGSGGVHRLPGGSLAIIPVHAQHRGRLFLPFADNDPKTAEIVSKVLLLAKDEEIMDPSILEQLGAPMKLPVQTSSDSGKPKSKTRNSKTAKAKRRYEFSEGKSNKFWEIELSEDSVVTTWGRIGNAGQSKTKKFANEEKAKQAFEKMISDKTGKGYSEV